MQQVHGRALAPQRYRDPRFLWCPKRVSTFTVNRSLARAKSARVRAESGCGGGGGQEQVFCPTGCNRWRERAQGSESAAQQSGGCHGANVRAFLRREKRESKVTHGVFTGGKAGWMGVVHEPLEGSPGALFGLGIAQQLLSVMSHEHHAVHLVGELLGMEIQAGNALR